MPGSTGVQTSAQEAWDQRKGVCQDIAHLTVALLRAVGIPARYVSGYLHPKPTRTARPGRRPEPRLGRVVVRRLGGHDPTNRAAVGTPRDRRPGRDYDDVPPLKGVYHGAPSQHDGRHRGRGEAGLTALAGPRPSPSQPAAPAFARG